MPIKLSGGDVKEINLELRGDIQMGAAYGWYLKQGDGD